MASADPGPLIATGRDADVFDVGDGRVLRRYRRDHDTAREAATMAHLTAHGYPVPVVHEASGSDLVMDRIDGPTMLNDLGRRPWRMRRHARVLADLHRRLADVPTDNLELGGEGPVIVHGDLHPENVMLSTNGPVVIDWPMASLGSPGTDTAAVWALLHAAEAPGDGIADRIVAALGRGLLLRLFLSASDEPAARRALPDVVERRQSDKNLTASEKTKMRELLAVTTASGT